MRQCKAITRLGNRCDHRAAPGSFACHIPKHIEQVENDHRILQWSIRSWYIIPAWKKFLGFLGFVISISLAIYYGEITPSKSDLKGTEDRVIKSQQASKQEIIDVITKAEKINRNRLDSEYPYGYVIMHADTSKLKEIKTELANFPPQNITIDFSKARTILLNKEYVKILLPDMTYRSPRLNITEFAGNYVLIRRKEGEKNWSGMVLGYATFWVEVLINQNDLLVLVLGFGPNK